MNTFTGSIAPFPWFSAFEQEHYDMYMRYQKDRHQDGGMANSTEEDYINFLSSHGVTHYSLNFQ